MESSLRSYDPRTGELLALTTQSTQLVENPETLAQDAGLGLPVENVRLFLGGKVATASLEEVTPLFEEQMRAMQPRRGGRSR
jgi:hypothetical protein